MTTTRKKVELIMNMPICNVCKIDKLFEIDCYQYTNLGTDSTIKEKNAVKKTSLYIYRKIKQLNERLGKRLLFHYG